MPRGEPRALRDRIAGAEPAETTLWGIDGRAVLVELTAGSSFGDGLERLVGRSVLIATKDQLMTALALVALDGVARRMVLCPADLRAEHVRETMAKAEIDALVGDGSRPDIEALPVPLRAAMAPQITPGLPRLGPMLSTEWVLMTSGTTGAPKLVGHSLAALTGAIRPGPKPAQPIVWGTFYDIRRYGGLQIFLRAMLGGASLVLSSAEEPVADFLQRLGSCGASHVSGTPSHWRRALMSPAVRAFHPRYVRLSGEIADQAVLDQLRATFPGAKVGHAFASTEAGVGFEVDDGLAGFPTSYLGLHENGVELALRDGSLLIRSPRIATGYVGGGALADENGFVDTGDLVERRGERYYFVGRKDGMINVGGQKLHPEEVEAVINRHPKVRMSLVKARRSPITGAVTVAEVVLRDELAGDARSAVEGEIDAACRAALAPHKVPAVIRFVPSLDVTPGGKLVRHGG